MTFLLKLLVLAAQGALPASYHVTPIHVPELDGGSFWTAALNNRADVAVSGANLFGVPVAKLIGAGGSYDLPALSAGEALSILHLANDRRVLATSHFQGSWRPGVWDPTGIGHELRRISGGTYATAVDGTGDGWIVGQSGASIPYASLPVVWLGGVLRPLDLPPGHTTGGCTAIDAHHRIVGWARGPAEYEQAWIREGLGAPVALGGVPGNVSSRLLALDATWGGVGWASDGFDTTDGLFWREGSYITLAAPSPYRDLWFAWINRLGTALGHLDDRGYPDPVVSDGRQLIMLHDRLDPASSARYYPKLAFGINDDGLILATCWDMWHSKLVLSFLTPDAGAAAATRGPHSAGLLPQERMDWLSVQAAKLRDREGPRSVPLNR